MYRESGLVAEARRHPRREARVHPGPDRSGPRRCTRSREIHEERGGALDLALQALARAWRIDVADDDSLTKLLSLAAKLDAWDDVVATLEEGAASAPNPELAAGLWARAAEIHEAQRNDLARAIEAWRKVEEAHGDDPVALAALDRLLAVEGRVDELVKVVARRAELAEDAGVRLVLLHRVAALYEEVLDDKPAAIAAYKNVLGVDDTDLTALDALERLYRATGEGRELASTLERKIELTAELPTRQALRHAAAEVYERQLDDVYQAIGHLTAILDDDAGEATALAELDRIYAKEKMWPELLDIVDRRALLASRREGSRRARVSRGAPRRGGAHRSRGRDPTLRRGPPGAAVAPRGARGARGADGQGRLRRDDDADPRARLSR